MPSVPHYSLFDGNTQYFFEFRLPEAQNRYTNVIICDKLKKIRKGKRGVKYGWYERVFNGGISGRPGRSARWAGTGRSGGNKGSQEAFFPAGRDVYPGNHRDLRGAADSDNIASAAEAGMDGRRQFCADGIHTAHVSYRDAGTHIAGADDSEGNGGAAFHQARFFRGCRHHVLCHRIYIKSCGKSDNDADRCAERRDGAEPGPECDPVREHVDGSTLYGYLRADYGRICFPQTDCGQDRPLWTGGRGHYVGTYVRAVPRKPEPVCICMFAGNVSGVPVCEDRQHQNYHCAPYDDQLCGRRGFFRASADDRPG